MQALDLYIKKKISAVRRRITTVLLVSYLFLGLVVGMGAAALIMLLSLFLPMYYAAFFATAAIILGLFTGVLLTFIKRPDMKRCALLLDSRGFKERVVTSYERAGKEDEFSRLLKEDTKDRLDGFDIRGAFPVKLPVNQVVAFLLLAVIVAVSGLIDSPARKQARAEHEIVMEAKKEAEKLTDALEKLEDQKELGEEEKKELTDMLEEAKKELLESEGAEDIDKAKERLTKKLEQNMKELLAEDKREAAKELFNMAMELNPSLSQEDKKELADAMEKLSELSDQLSDAKKQAEEKGLDSLSEEELSELAANLNKAAANMSDEELAAALKNAAASVSEADLEEALSTLANAQGNVMAAGIDSDGSVSLASASGENSAGGEGTENGAGAGTGANGQGSGQGSPGGNGTGWYNGSDKGAESEEIYNGDFVSVPENYQDNENLTGKPVEGDSYKQEGGPSLTWDGIRMNYQQVIGDYVTKAYERIESGSYPADYKEAIRYYFEYLNQ